MGNVFEDFLARAQQKPKGEPRPEPLRCEGTTPSGRCHTVLRAFAMFGRWHRPTLCEECASSDFGRRQRELLLPQALEEANLDGRERSIDTDPHLEQWLDDPDSRLLYAYADDGVTGPFQGAARRYITLRTSSTHKASARFDTEYMMINSLRGSGSAQPRDYIGPKLLVVDQVGHITPTPFVLETWYGILSERHRLGRKTMLGGVWSLKELADRGYDRALLRLIYDQAGGEAAATTHTLQIIKL